jgi:hypothetical protein
MASLESIPSLAKSIPRNRFLSFLNVYNYRLSLVGGGGWPAPLRSKLFLHVSHAKRERGGESKIIRQTEKKYR